MKSKHCTFSLFAQGVYSKQQKQKVQILIVVRCCYPIFELTVYDRKSKCSLAKTSKRL